jgi:translation initiation factor IF-2
MDLAEKGIYLEGFGGDVPYAEISAKVGTNISHLLDLILLVAQLNEFTTDPGLPATGIIIESSLDPKRGMSGTIIIKDGTLKKGMFVVVEDSFVTTRIMENFLGKSIDEASACSPVRLLGFDREPRIGAFFLMCII